MHFSESSNIFEPDAPEYIECMDGCEEHIDAFFSGRSLINQRAIHDEQQKNHDEKYDKELEYDERDNAKGKGPYFKKYRKEFINTYSNCDAQYVNNLHTYFGDGSKLKHEPRKPHYAVDLICPNGVDTDATTELKTLEVLQKKKSVLNWVRKNRKEGNISSPLRRSVSCCDLRMEINPKTEITHSVNRKYDPFASLFDLDTDYNTSLDSIIRSTPILTQNIHRDLSTAIKQLVSLVNAFKYPVGKMEISTVLFSREYCYGYVIPAARDTQQLLREFSAAFEKWFVSRPAHVQSILGTEEDGRYKKMSANGKPFPYYWRSNVILCLEEFSEENTKFRRARHVCRIMGNRHLYLEIDTGKLRTVETTELTVRRMPPRFARFPTPILEICFEGVENQVEMAIRIAEIRESRVIWIDRFNEGNRTVGQKTHYEEEPKANILNDLETAVIRRIKKPQPTRLTSLFCDEVCCMGLCCTERFLKKSEALSSTASIPSAWVAEKDRKEKKKKFEYTSVTSTLQPLSPSKNTSHLQPLSPPIPNHMSTLEPANMSNFFKR